MRDGPICCECGRSAKRGQYLYLKQVGDKDVEQWLCHRKSCDDSFNGVLPEEDDRMLEGGFKPGDTMPDGRIVDEVDDKGRPTIVHRPKSDPPPPPPPIAAAVRPQPKPAPKKKRARKDAPAVNTAAVAEKAAAANPKPKKESKPVTQKKTTAAKTTKAPAKKATTKKATAKKAPAKKAPAKKAPVKKAKAKAATKKKTTTRTQTKWTDELKATVRARLEDGETYAAIAPEFNITPQTLWANLNRKK
jgi:hypothetical protein